MIALDTSVLVRFLVVDDAYQTALAVRLIEQAIQGDVTLYLSNIVVAETVWVSSRSYRFTRAEIAAVIHRLLAACHFGVGSRRGVTQALRRFEIGAGDFADYCGLPSGASSAEIHRVVARAMQRTACLSVPALLTHIVVTGNPPADDVTVDLLRRAIPEIAEDREHQGVGIVLNEQAGAVAAVHVNQTIAVVEQFRLFDASGHGQWVGAYVNQKLTQPDMMPGQADVAVIDSISHSLAERMQAGALVRFVPRHTLRVLILAQRPAVLRSSRR